MDFGRADSRGDRVDCDIDHAQAARTTAKNDNKAIRIAVPHLFQQKALYKQQIQQPFFWHVDSHTVIQSQNGTPPAQLFADGVP